MQRNHHKTTTPPKRPLQQRLKQVLRLPLRLALLCAQPLEAAQNVGKYVLLLKRSNRHQEFDQSSHTNSAASLAENHPDR